MEMSEKIKICSTCKNREFNPECGTVCSFTKDKPSFEEVCDKYAADEAQLSKEASKAEALEEEKSISGWLAFFVIVKTCSDSLFTILPKNCPMTIAKLHTFPHSHNRMKFYQLHSVLLFPDFAADTFLRLLYLL